MRVTWVSASAETARWHERAITHNHHAVCSHVQTLAVTLQCGNASVQSFTVTLQLLTT